MLETAEKWGRPPSYWLSNDEEWGDKDRILTLVYTMYKDGLCSCGHPAIISHDEEHDGWIVAKTTVCHACAAADRKMEDGKPVKGQKIYTVDERKATSGEPVSEHRTALE